MASKGRMKNRAFDLPETAVTQEALYLRRRDFLRATAAVSLVAAGCLPGEEGAAKSTDAPSGEPLASVVPAPAGPSRATDDATPWEAATSYNNFYELGVMF